MFEVQNTRKRKYFVDFPLIGPLIISILVAVSMKTYDVSKPAKDQTIDFKEKWDVIKATSNVVTITNASFVENKYPNVVSRKLVTKPYNLPVIYDFKYTGNIGKDAVIPKETEIRNYSMSAEAYLVKMKKVYVTNEGIVFANDVFYTDDCACHWRVCNSFRGKFFPKQYSYTSVEQAICITHEYGWFFAHWLIDFMPKFSVIPKDILLKSKIIITNMAAFTINGLEFFGVSQKNIIAPLPDTAIFCDTLYTVEPIICTKFNAYLLLNLRQMIIKACNLDKNAPTDYIVYNRENTDYRKIGNYKEIFDTIKEKYPQHPWKNINIRGGIKDQAKQFNAMKLFVAMHGAAFANTLFMQPNTAVVEIQVDRWVDNYLWISAYTQVHHLFSRDMTVKWRESGSKNIIDKDQIVKLVGMALESMQKAEKK